MVEQKLDKANIVLQVLKLQDESLDLALEAILVMCKDHDDVGSIITSKYRTESTWFKDAPPIKTFRLLPKILCRPPMSMDVDFTTLRHK